MMYNEIIFFIFGVAIGWLASLSTRKAHLIPMSHASNSCIQQYPFLSTVFDRTLLEDIYILVDNLYALAKNIRNIRFVLMILFFITSSGDSIDSGIVKLKHDYPNLLVPSTDTALRALHALTPEEVNRMILSTIRAIFDVARRHRSHKDIRTITHHVWLAVDLTSILYYGRMGSQRKKHVYKRGAKFISRSHAYIHNTKEGKALKYLTVAIAAGPMSGLLVYVAPLRAGYSLSEEVDRMLSYLSLFMSIDLVLMDRGFYSGDVYEVLRRHNIKFLTPAVKSKGVKQTLLEITAPERIAARIEQLTMRINEFVGHKFHGRGYKGIRQLKEMLRSLNTTLYNVNSVAELLSVLQRIRKLSDSRSDAIVEAYEKVRETSEEVIELIMNPPRLIVEEFQLNGRTKSAVILSMHFNEDAFREAIERKFRSTATRRRGDAEVRGLDFEKVLEKMYLDSYYLFVSPNFKMMDVSVYGETYKRRWTVETAHKMFHEVMLYTTSNDITVRNMELLIAVTMYNLWVIHRENKGKEEEHVYKTSLREFKRDFRRNEFFTFQYDKGYVFLVLHGEIVDVETYIKSIEDRVKKYKRERRGSRVYGRTMKSARPPPLGVPVYLVLVAENAARARRE